MTFRREGEKKYREYTPDMIDAFGFIHESKFYSFKSFTLQYNSITPRQREQHRFLLLVYAGRADLYQDVEYYKSPSDANSASPNKRNLYFLFNEAQGLVRVDLDEQHPTIRALLEQFSFEPEFVDQVPEDANVKDIRKILQDYDTWSLEHRLH